MIDKFGFDVDECMIMFDDCDGCIEFLLKGVMLKVLIGWEG